MALPSQCESMEEYFRDALQFLKSHHWIYSHPNTHILADRVLEQIPEAWLPYLKQVSVDELNQLALAKLTEKQPDPLKDFLKQLNHLKPCLKITRRSIDKLPKHSSLGKKKEHEILALAPLVSEIYTKSNSHHIIDIGSGLGYLPRLLFEKYSYSVTGIEGSQQKIERAMKRNTEGITYIHHFVTSESEGFFSELLEGLPDVCLVGLHACADLSVTVLKLFAKLEQIKSLVMMPCCYHRLEQENGCVRNFPASKLLSGLIEEMRIDLGVPFLRLACQESPIKVANMSEADHEKHARNCLFRAILQVVAQEGNYQVRRLRRKSGKSKQSGDICGDPFEAYLANLPFTHALIGGEITDDKFIKKMREKWTLHKENTVLIEALAAFQAAIQSVCENIVLLDRVVVLREMGVTCCYVEKVTDDGLSPRCHALVAIKS